MKQYQIAACERGKVLRYDEVLVSNYNNIYIYIYRYICVCSIYTYAALLQVNRVFASSTDANRTRFRDQGQETQDLPVGELYCTNSGVGNQSQYSRVFRDEKNRKETWGCVQLVSANMSYVFTILYFWHCEWQNRSQHMFLNKDQ